MRSRGFLLRLVAGGRRTRLSRSGTVRFGRMQKAEMQTTARFGCQLIMQSCFAVVSVGRSFELIGLGRVRREARVNLVGCAADVQRFTLSHDEAIWRYAVKRSPERVVRLRI